MDVSSATWIMTDEPNMFMTFTPTATVKHSHTGTYILYNDTYMYTYTDRHNIMLLCTVCTLELSY